MRSPPGLSGATSDVGRDRAKRDVGGDGGRTLPGLVDIRDRRYNIRSMSCSATNARHARWLALALWPIWLGALLAPLPGAAEEPTARLRVPGIDAACRTDANQRARSELRLQAVEWVEAPTRPGAAPRDAPAVARVEIAGRAWSPGGWVRLTANCTYAKGGPAVILIRAQPAPPLDLSGVTRLSEPASPSASNPPVAPVAPPGSAAAEAGPSVRLKPSLTEMPFDPLTMAKRQDFLKDHLLGIKLQAPF